VKNILTNKWTVSDNEERFSEEFDTEKEAVAYGMGEFYGEQFWVAQINPIIPRIDAKKLLERFSEDIFEVVGDIAEDYLCNIDKKLQLKLEKQLNKVFHEWLTKTKNWPNFYAVKNVKQINPEDQKL